MITFKEYDNRTDQYVADEIKKRKLAKHVVNATDDYRMKKGKAAFTMPHHTGSSTIHVYLRKMAGPSKGVMAYNYELKFDEEYCCDECFDHIIEASEYQGRKVELNNPTRSNDGKKKFYVYVKNEKGNVVKVGFGDPNMEIKRDDPARRKSFRARHNCDNPGPKWKARYWSCYQWRAGAKVDN